MQRPLETSSYAASRPPHVEFGRRFGLSAPPQQWALATERQRFDVPVSSELVCCLAFVEVCVFEEPNTDTKEG